MSIVTTCDHGFVYAYGNRLGVVFSLKMTEKVFTLLSLSLLCQKSLRSPLLMMKSLRSPLLMMKGQECKEDSANLELWPNWLHVLICTILDSFYMGSKLMHLRNLFRFLTLFFLNYLLLGTVLLPRSFYSPNLGRRQPLGEGLESWFGFYQSICPTQMGLSLIIDMSSTAFIEPLPIIDFVKQLSNRASSFLSQTFSFTTHSHLWSYATPFLSSHYCQ